MLQRQVQRVIFEARRLASLGRSEFESRLRSADVRHFAPRGAPAVMASRTALIEEGAVESVHAKLIADRAPPQVGLIVGKRSVGARDLILALVPFPDWNAEKGDGDGDVGAPCTPSRPASGGTPLHIDVDSIVEHATQVTRMLPGGLDVVGAYAFAAEQAWRSASTALANAVVDAAEAAAFETPRTFEKETNDPKVEQFLLHLSAEDKSKTSLRRVDRSSVGRPFTSLPPAEWREGRALANVVRLDAEHAFEWSVVLPSKRTTMKGTEKQHTLRSLLESACALEIARVEQSEILVENATWDDETAIATVPRRKATERVDQDEESRDADDTTDETVSSTTNVFKLHAELLAPPLSCTSGDVTCDSRDATRSRAASDATDGAARLDPSSQTRLDGEPSLRLTFKGVVSARAYSSARETVFEASSDLRRDIARSLRSRLDAFLDRADDALENDEDSQNDNALAFLERRFFASEGRTDGSGEPFADRLADAIKARRVMNDSPKNERLTLALPRRAWVEWRQVGLAVCDYLADSETEADVVARCAEVMGFDVAGGVAGVVLAEREGLGSGSFPFPGGASFSGANGHDNKGAEVNAEVSSMKRSEKKTSGKKPTSQSSSYAAYVLGAGVALLSAGLANLYMTGRPSEIAECLGEMCDFAAEVA